MAGDSLYCDGILSGAIYSALNVPSVREGRLSMTILSVQWRSSLSQFSGGRLLVSSVEVVSLSVQWRSSLCQFSGGRLFVSSVEVVSLSVQWRSSLCQFSRDRLFVSSVEVVSLSVQWRSSLCRFSGGRLFVGSVEVVSRPPTLNFPKIQGFQGGFLGFQTLFKVFR